MEMHDPEDERFRDAIAQEGMVPSNFQTDVVIYKAEREVPGAEPELEPILEDSIQMNKPAKFDGYTLYQQGYQQNEFSSMTFKIHETDDEDATAIDSFTVDLFDPEPEYILDSGFRVVIEHYFPDYYLTEDGTPASETNYPRNPAFVLLVYPPESDTPEVSFLGIGRNSDATAEDEYKVAIQDLETHFVSGLTIRVDRTLIFFGLGAAVFMIGVIQGMYWQHRRVWIHPKENGILLAAHTNKNWFGLSKDIEKAIEDTNINMVEDRQDLDKS